MDRIERLAAALHQQWAQQRRYVPRLADDGSGRQIDLAAAPFAELPAAWQAENLEAARSALRAVEATVDVSDPHRRVEVVAAMVHDAWVQRHAMRDGPSELLVAYEHLTEQERDKDRVIARLALGEI